MEEEWDEAGNRNPSPSSPHLPSVFSLKFSFALCLLPLHRPSIIPRWRKCRHCSFVPLMEWLLSTSLRNDMTIRSEENQQLSRPREGILFLQFSSTRCPAIHTAVNIALLRFDSVVEEYEFGNIQGMLFMFSVSPLLHYSKYLTLLFSDGDNHYVNCQSLRKTLIPLSNCSSTLPPMLTRSTPPSIPMTTTTTNSEESKIVDQYEPGYTAVQKKSQIANAAMTIRYSPITLHIFFPYG
ncbi:hypothetical protein VNO80_13223 [Phaseolus coccineus]|uniref:Uncharacterized protein n=1 Tax=Phaseolus coccineus TaxID=3886 RepID=A0AAN9N5V4_PHACN